MQLDVARLRQALEGRRIGVPLVYRESTGSTNDDAMELGRRGAEEGTTVLADQQSHGRGRLGRRWESPPGRNLYLSVVLRPPIRAADAPQLGIVAGVAVVEAIRRWLPEAVLKWPNDVLVAGRKIAGILVEMAAKEEAVDFVVVGIGVNVNLQLDDLPAELQQTAGSIAQALGREVDRTEVALAVLEQLEREYERYLQHGFAPIRTRWLDRAGILDRRLVVDSGGTKQEGIAVGLSETGALQLQRDDGTVVEILSGDVTLHESGGTRD